MARYKYTVRLLTGRVENGEMDGNSEWDVEQKVTAAYPEHVDGSIQVDEKYSAVKKVAEGTAVGIGCLGIGILQLLMSAIPIAIAILIVIWVLRGCL